MSSDLEAANQKLFAEASALYDAGDHKGAAVLFRRAALNGDDGSQLNLGYLYDEGLGVRRNPKIAMAWYRKAARQGNCSAANNIATIHRDRGNHRRAIEWFRRAMGQGCASSALTLAALFLSLGRDQDARGTLMWARKRRRALSEADCEQLETFARKLGPGAKKVARQKRSS
jgi:uncharacterized protein